MPDLIALGIAFFLLQRGAAFFFKDLITDSSYLIKQVDIEIKCQADAKGEPRTHTV